MGLCLLSYVVSMYAFDVYLGSASSVIHMGVCIWIYFALCCPAEPAFVRL